MLRRAASSQSVLSYKFTSQTLTGAGVSCVCSSGSRLFGKREMLQCQREGWGGLGCLGRALPRQAIGSAEKVSPGSNFSSNPSS